MRTQRLTGLILVLVSATVFSTAGLFTKGVSADAWSVIFWRGLFAAGFTLIYILIKGTLRSELLELGKVGFAVAAISSVASASFITSFKLTTIANVSLIYASAPFIAALIAWLSMGERPSFVVMISSLAALAGVSLIVGSSIGGVNFEGDLMAIWMTFLMALILVIYRRYPKTPGPGPMTLSCIFLLPAALYFSDPLSAPENEILLMALFGLIFAIASVTLVLGARYLPSSETALVSSIEAPLAILFAWLLFSEEPGVNTFIGGVIILLAVFCSQILSRSNQSA